MTTQSVDIGLLGIEHATVSTALPGLHQDGSELRGVVAR
jgi:hypothetical protein